MDILYFFTAGLFGTGRFIDLILFYDLNVYKKFKPKPILPGFGGKFLVCTLGVEQYDILAF